MPRYRLGYAKMLEFRKIVVRQNQLYTILNFQFVFSVCIFHANEWIGVVQWLRQNSLKTIQEIFRSISMPLWHQFLAKSEHLDFSCSRWVNGCFSVMTSLSRKTNTFIVLGVVKTTQVGRFLSVVAIQLA